MPGRAGWPPLVPVALALVAGILLGPRARIPASWLIAAGALAACSAIGVRHRRAAAWLVLAAWVAVGMARETRWRDRGAVDVGGLAPAEPAAVVARGVIVDDPLEWWQPSEPFEAPGEPPGRVERVPALARARVNVSAPAIAPQEPRSPRPDRQVLVLAVSHVRLAGDRGPPEAWRAASGLVRVRLQGRIAPLECGDELLVAGRWSRVPGPGNPGQFDWRAALARQRIETMMSVAPHEALVRLGPGRRGAWLRGVFRVRRTLQQRIERNFREPYAGLLRSLLLGQRVALDDDLRQAFVETGTMHLLVISGFNVGLLAWLLELALRLIGLPLRLRLAGTAAALAGYCLITGMQPPVLRATIMAVVVLGGIWLDRLVNWPNTLALAAIVMLLWSPAQVADPGFQLSFGAVISLLAWCAPIHRALERGLARLPSWPRRYLAVGLASTLAVWVGLWPLLAWYFHLVAPVSVLANLLLVPVVSLAVGAGTLVLALGALCEPLIRLSAGWLIWLVDATVTLVRWCQALPLGVWPVGRPSWPVVLGYFGLLGLTSLRRRLRMAPGRLLIVWLAAAALWVGGAVVAASRAARWTELTVMDVGHGDSLLVDFGGRQRWLIDAGTRQAGHSVVVPLLRHRGVRELEALVLTHQDEDHLGGAVAVLKSLKVRKLLTNGFRPSSATAREVIGLAGDRAVAYTRLAAGMRLRAPGAELDVLHPPADWVDRPPAGLSSNDLLLSSNDRSLVLRLRHGAVSVLLCGDLEERGVPRLLGWGEGLAASVLKVPHHGSALGGAAAEFFARIRPELAIISVGRLHGLPAPVTVEQLRSTGARILTTREAGAVTIRTDGRRIQVRTFRNRPPEKRLETRN